MEIRPTPAMPTGAASGGVPVAHPSPHPLARRTRNAMCVVTGFFRKTDKRSRIQVLKQKAKLRKKVFGLQYMDLYEKEAEPIELQRCLEAAWLDVQSLNGAAASLREQIDRIESETQARIIRKHGAQCETAPSLTVSDHAQPPMYKVESGVQDYDPSNYAFAVVADVGTEAATAPQTSPMASAPYEDDDET